MRKLSTGDTLDNLKIERELHASAVATLYKVKDIISGNLFVVKIPLDDLINNPVIFYHYQNEDRIGRKLDSPFIVKFYDRFKSHQYSIMEYVEGDDLRQLLSKSKPFDLDLAIDIYRKAAIGCAYLHDQNVLHLDLKPENIMLTPAGEVKLIDFGLSHQLDYGDYLNQDFADPKGTPYYISPEQLCTVRTLQQSDIYCLAMVLYEMITGELPFDKSTSLEKADERRKVDPTPPRYHNPDVPPGIQDFILQCLQKDPADRPQSFQECLEQLEDYKKLPSGQYGEITTKPIPLLTRFDTLECSILHSRIASTMNSDAASKTAQQILVCIADDDSCDAVIDWLLRETVGSTAEITLLHVLDETVENEFEKFADEVGGGSLFNRLDNYLTELNKYGIEPLLRIKQGPPAGVIMETAKHISADLIVIGRPRRKSRISKIFSGSVMEGVVESDFVNVIVAQSVMKIKPPAHLNISLFTHKEIHNLELFLLNCWVEHTDMLREISLADNSNQGGELCELAKWLLQLLNSSKKIEGIEQLFDLDTQFHESLTELNKPLMKEQHGKALNIYNQRLYPLLIEMKNHIHSLMHRIKSENVLERGFKR